MHALVGTWILAYMYHRERSRPLLAATESWSESFRVPVGLLHPGAGERSLPSSDPVLGNNLRHSDQIAVITKQTSMRTLRA
jgi:hypothetical protein